MDYRKKQQELNEAESNTKRLRDEINSAQRSCNHQWNKPKFDPVARTEYDNDLSSPVIRDGGSWHYKLIPKTVYDNRWSRSCELCGKVEYTTKSEVPQNFSKVPVF